MAQDEISVDLSELKDIHIPLQPDFWPLAEGFYILMAGGLFLLLLSVYLWKRHQRLPLPYALKELEKIKKTLPENQMKLLSQLLKRVAMVRYERKEIAPLTEENWQDFLLAAAPNLFTKEQAKNLAYAIYNTSTPDEKLFKSCQKWIKIIINKRDTH